MKLTLLPSDKGDCLFLESPDKTTVLIDGGMPDSYSDHVRDFLGKWHRTNHRPLDLVYVSHIDQDHIAGVLQLMNDLVDWRVYRHKTANGEQWDKPDFPEPPEVKRIWHNGFHDMAGDNASEIGSMLAARAAQLTAEPVRQQRACRSGSACLARFRGNRCGFAAMPLAWSRFQPAEPLHTAPETL